MKKLLSLFSFSVLLATGSSFAQYSYQDINSQLVVKSIDNLASDNNGNVIVSGYFTTTITLGNITLTGSTGLSVGFVAKLDPNGSFTWAKCINLQHGPGQVDIGKMATDAAGNIYITGGYMGMIKMDNISLTSTKGTWDIFTVKISSGGVFLWAKSEGTGDDANCAGESGNSVTTDGQGNVYTTGNIVGRIYKNTNYSACGCGSGKPIYDIYVVKYNSSGTKLWEKKYINSLQTSSATCDGVPMGRDIRSDGTNVYIAGNMYGSITFGSVTLNTGSNTIDNAFLLKLDFNGNTLWAKSATNTDNTGQDLILDNSNNDVYLNGYFTNGTILFGGPSVSSNIQAQYIAKYSSSGICSWAITTNKYAINNFSGHHIFKHPDGNIAAFVGEPINPPFNTPFLFTLKEYSTIDGVIVDSTVASAQTLATDVVSLPGGFVYAQNLKGSYDFGGITISSTQPTTSNFSDMILVKYSSAPPPMVHPTGVTSTFVSSGITLYPNPAADQITIAISPDEILGSVSIVDMTGKIVFQNKYSYSEARIDVQDFAPGIYFIKAGLEETIKFVKQ